MKINIKELSKRVLNSITLKVIIVLFLIISLSLICVGFVINNTVGNKFTEVIKNRNYEIASIMEKKANDFFKTAVKRLKIMSGDYGLRSNNQISIVAKSMFNEELEQNDYFESIYFISKDKDTSIVVSKLKKAKNLSNEYLSYVDNANGNINWTNAHRNINKSGFTTTVIVAVFDYNDNFIGIIGADISLDALSSLINWDIGNLC